MKTFVLFFCGLFFLAMAACTKTDSAAQGGGGKAGSLARFAVVGDYLYIVDRYALKTYNISDIQAPLFKSEVQLGVGIETIFPYDNKLYIGSESAMYICSLGEPEHPKVESRVQHLRSCDPVVVQGTTAYVTLRAGVICGGNFNLLIVYDVTDMANPKAVKQLPLTTPYGLGVAGDALYVCDAVQGLLVYDIRSPRDPKLQHRISINNASFRDVIPYRGTLVAQLTNGVSFYDIGQPLQPQHLSTLNNP